MKRTIAFSAILFLMLTFLSGCTPIEAERGFEGSFIINGETYVPISAAHSGQVSWPMVEVDGHSIHPITEDSSRCFLEVRSFLDNWTIVKESYVIPTSGKLNVVYYNHERITPASTDNEKWNLAQSIRNNDFSGSFVIQATSPNDIYNATKSVYFGYEDCPLGTDFIGGIGIINEQLVFIKKSSLKSCELIYTCYILNDEYQHLFESSGNTTFEVIG